MIAESFEKRLTDASSPEVVKAAKLLLKNGMLSCAWRDENGVMHGAFQEKEYFDYTDIKTGEANEGYCSCGELRDKLCRHAVALIMYMGRFSGTISIGDDDEVPAQFAGLKYKSIPELLENVSEAPTARLEILAESMFPHVPSKWENALFVVKLHCGQKEYIGNVSNLRNLHFNKTLAASLKLSCFSQQERQIIRYFAVNAEPESSKLMLNSEQTAEFLHCLVGYDNFYRSGRKVLVHREAAEAVMLCSPGGKGVTISSALDVAGAILPLQGPRVITGRSGCWVGLSGEYWWVPATVDVGWLRSFLRARPQDMSLREADMFIRGLQDFPLRIVEAPTGELKIKKCRPNYSAELTSDDIFRVKLDFVYDNVRFPDDDGRLTANGGNFWLRDSVRERELVDELIKFGFERINDNGRRNVFTLHNLEAAGIFLDKMIRHWIREGRDFTMDPALSRLCCGGNGIDRLIMNCTLFSSDTKSNVIKYDLRAGKSRAALPMLIKTVNENRRYLQTADGRLGRISKRMHSFIRAAEKVIQHIDPVERTFEVLFYAVPYWVAAGKDIPGIVPVEFESLADSLKLKPHNGIAAHDAAIYHFQGELRPYQNKGVEWLKRLTDMDFNLILADEMGLGKTIQTLAFLAARMDGKSDPAMVICPASLVENWKRESVKFVPDLKVIAISGAERDALWSTAEKAGLIIVSYSIAKRDMENLRKLKFSYLVLDEAQHIKNPATVNARNCKALKAVHRLVLTGTPLENSPEDLWSIFDFLHPGLLGSYHGFKKYYAGIGEDQELQSDLAARVAPFILRRIKVEVATELPPKQEQVLYCEMSSAQRRLYNEVLEYGRTQVAELAKGGHAAAPMEVLTTLLRLRQICCHPTLLPNDQGINVDSAKFELLKELILQNLDSGHKFLLFSQFTSLLKIIKDWLDEEKIIYEYLDGATRNRQERVDNFNNGDIPLFLLSLKAGGTGLNLTAADTVIIYDPWWNPAVEMQATDRTHRIGQTRPVSSLKLVVKDSVEEKIMTMQQKKQDIFDNLIENPAASVGKLSLEELQLLLTPSV